jgi:hypothetical protein
MLSISRRYIICLIAIISIPSFAAPIYSSNKEVREKCLKIEHAYLKEAFFLTQNTVGFTAAISGRSYGYITVGMYESLADMIPELTSLDGQLNEYVRPQVKARKVNWMIVANETDYQLLSYFYRAMPPSNQKQLYALYDSIHQKFSSHEKRKTVERSKKYAKTIADAIIAWSKKDGGDDGFERNYPPNFEPETCPSCWSRTFPGYLTAQVPFWGTNRPMLEGSQNIAADLEIFPFDTIPETIMYKEAVGVLQNSKEKDPEFEIIAEYWNDAAGYSGTPSGHFFTIAQYVAIQQDLPLDKALELYVKLGVAVNEAFISSFGLKYKFNFIRPITYIQRYIDPSFNSRLASPPFPEFPSGHSFQSGAASEVMKSIFGDTITFIDYTNSIRKDIDGKPRRYTSFTEMSEEISISRFYGGIHFRKTLDISLAYGRKIGRYVSKELECRK